MTDVQGNTGTISAVSVGEDSRIAFSTPSTRIHHGGVAAYGEQSAGDFQVSVQASAALPTYSYGQIANQLTNVYWDGDFHHWGATQGDSITVNLTALTPEGQVLARAALAEWTDIIGVHFTEMTTGGQITFDDNEGGAFTNVSWSNHITVSAAVNISTQWLTDYGTALDGYAFQTYIHEIGHALGLGHPGDYDGSASYPADATFSNDSWATSVMSYFSQQDSSYFADQGFTKNFVLTPMIGDIVAMENLYGLSTTTRTGNTTYGFNSNANRDVFQADVYPGAAYTIFDNGGVDTLDYSGFGTSQLINLNPEAFMNIGSGLGNVVIAPGVVIENAIGGAGNDRLIGNGANNVLDGGLGIDTASYETSAGGVTIDLRDSSRQATGGAGSDVLRSIENLVGSSQNDDLTGSAVANSLFGGAGADKLIGLAGDDALDGGAGIDVMRGGLGNDTYYVDDAHDKVVESSGEGTDTVIASVNYSLSSNVENLTLTGSAAKGVGNSLANHLVGTSGANVLNGGAGADVMSGGGDDDTYSVDNVGDSIVESSGGGRDQVNSTVSFALASNVEDLFLRGSSAIDATGNNLDNVLHGNSGANLLSGGVGSDNFVAGGGADTLIGGAGTDRMTGGGAGDTFVFHNGDFGGLTHQSCDEIRDFSHSQGDKIDLSAVDANSLVGGQQDYLFIGTADFHHVAGELRYEEINGNTYVLGDANGDGTADMMIRLDGLHALTSADFVI